MIQQEFTLMNFFGEISTNFGSWDSRIRDLVNMEYMIDLIIIGM
jgi:hypothetical protein